MNSWRGTITVLSACLLLAYVIAVCLKMAFAVAFFAFLFLRPGLACLWLRWDSAVLSSSLFCSGMASGDQKVIEKLRAESVI